MSVSEELIDLDSANEAARAARRQVIHIGSRIRALRQDHMTLSQLAEASGVSIGLLSRLENGAGNPSFSVLNAIARALEVDVQSFFGSAVDPVAVVHRQRRAAVTMRHSGVRVEMLVPDFDSAILGHLVTLPPAHAPRSLVGAAAAQIFELVLEGSVEYRIDFERHRLTKGDAILFPAERAHARRNLSASTPATIFSCSPLLQVDSFFSTGKE